MGPGDPAVRSGPWRPSGPSSVPTTPYTLLTQNNLAPVYQAVGQTARAIAPSSKPWSPAGPSSAPITPPRSALRTTSPGPTRTPADWSGQSPYSSERWQPGGPSSAPTSPSPSCPESDLAAALPVQKAIYIRAEPMLRDILAAGERKLGPPSTPDVAESVSLLGRILLGAAEVGRRRGGAPRGAGDRGRATPGTIGTGSTP